MATISPGLLLILTAFAYLVSSGLYGAGIVRRGDGPRRELLTAGLAAAAVGALLHTAAIGARCVQTHLPPFVTAPDSLSAVGWAIALGFLILQICPVRDRMAALGALGMPLAFLSVFAGSVSRLSHPPGSRTASAAGTRLLDGNLVSLHVLAIILAFGLLALAVGCALLYLMEDRMLKRKSVAQLLFWRLPSLTIIDNLAFTLVSLAFPLLTIGIVAGVIRAVAAPHASSAWSVEPHTLASIVTWAIYGIYLWLHAGRSWRGPRANSLLLVGLAAALVTYFVPSTLHHFG